MREDLINAPSIRVRQDCNANHFPQTLAAVLFLLFAVACGVPTPPSVPELETRAGEGDPDAVEGLLDLIGRDSPIKTRAQVYRALVKVGKRGEDHVLSACRDTDAVRREHALALAANLKLAGTYDEAVRALNDGSFPRRYVAAWALGEIGDARGAKPLLAALGRETGETAREAARSLVRLGRSSTPLLLEAVPGLRGESRGYALRMLGDLRDPRAAEALVAALADPETRSDAAWALGKLGVPEVAESLAPHLADSDWRVRLEVAKALGLLEAREVDAALDGLRAADPVPAVREWAARSLALLRGQPEEYPNARGEWVEPDRLYR
jgi:HEAT repeat protein